MGLQTRNDREHSNQRELLLIRCHVESTRLLCESCWCSSVSNISPPNSRAWSWVISWSSSAVTFIRKCFPVIASLRSFVRPVQHAETIFALLKYSHRFFNGGISMPNSHTRGTTRQCDHSISHSIAQTVHRDFLGLAITMTSNCVKHHQRRYPCKLASILDQLAPVLDQLFEDKGSSKNAVIRVTGSFWLW